jgi:hypothetical protein
MHTFEFRHIKYLRWHKIIATCFFVCASLFASAQEEGYNMLDHDNRSYYFGMTAGLNNSQYKMYYSDYFGLVDSVKTAIPRWNAGFQVGITANYRFTPHSSIRTMPQFVLTQKTIDYTFNGKPNFNLVVESIMLHMPFHYKFCSDRIGNFRFYTFTGARFDYDFNSNTRSRRNDDYLKIRPIDFGYDIGFGFDFYKSNYIFTPEIKLSNGFANVQKRDNDILTSKVFDKITTRMVFVGIIIGG